MSTQKQLYRTAAGASFSISLLHVAMMFIGAPAYRFFDAGDKMAELSEAGSPTPTLVTIPITLGFAGFGAYGLGGAGDIAELPAQKRILQAIAGIYLLRGMVLIPETVRFFTRGYSRKSMAFSTISLLVGLLYATASLTGDDE